MNHPRETGCPRCGHVVQNCSPAGWGTWACERCGIYGEEPLPQSPPAADLQPSPMTTTED